MKHVFLSLLLLFPLYGLAEESTDSVKDGPAIDQLYLETRLAWEGERLDKKAVDDNTGFKGQFFNLRFDGQLTKGLTFSYRQRLSKKTGQTFWDATDWVHLDWQINQHWGLSGGKQVVAVGGYEYDRAPIDLYYCSEYWQHIACYQLGVSGTYSPTSKDKLLFQVCNSPFRSTGGNNTYALNLVWYGHHGWWEPIWSINAMQNDKHGHWLNVIALGNRFHMGRYVHLDVDVVNRAARHQAFLFKDMSVISELSGQPHPSTRLFAQYTFDRNESGTDADLWVTNGTKLHGLQGGIEYAPLRKYRQHLRLFATTGYYWGRNTHPEAVMHDRQLMVQAGVKFRLDILGGFNALMEKVRSKK